MGSVSIIRKLDDLGRIVLPAPLRNQLNILPNDYLEITLEGDAILLRRHRSACVFCGRTEDLSLFKNKPICTACLRQLKGD